MQISSILYFWYEDVFRVAGPVCGEATGYQGIPHTGIQWFGAFKFSALFSWTSWLANSKIAGELKHRSADVESL